MDEHAIGSGGVTLVSVLSSTMLGWSSECRRKSEEVCIWVFTKYGLCLLFKSLRPKNSSEDKISGGR